MLVPRGSSSRVDKRRRRLSLHRDHHPCLLLVVHHLDLQLDLLHSGHHSMPVQDPDQLL